MTPPIHNIPFCTVSKHDIRFEIAEKWLDDNPELIERHSQVRIQRLLSDMGVDVSQTWLSRQIANRGLAAKRKRVIKRDGCEYIKATKAAKIVAYNPDYVCELGRKGKIRSIKLGHYRFVALNDLREHLEREAS